MRPGELSFPLKTGNNFKSLYTALLSDSQLSNFDLFSGEFMLLLLALLSEIISFQYAFTPLLESSDSQQTKSGVRNRTSTRGNAGVNVPMSLYEDNRRHITAQNTLEPTEFASGYVNPFLPFSAEVECKRIKHQFNKALDKLRATARDTSNSDPQPDGEHRGGFNKTHLPLLHFCRMVLEAGSDLWLLAALSGYVPLPKDSSEENITVAPITANSNTVPLFDSATVSAAWQVLEAIKANDTYTGSDAVGSITPVWYPLIVFYAALVVWSAIIHDSSTSDPSFIAPARKRLLGTFCQDLESMKPQWGCTKRMTKVIKGLMTNI